LPLGEPSPPAALQRFPSGHQDCQRLMVSCQHARLLARAHFLSQSHEVWNVGHINTLDGSAHRLFLLPALSHTKSVEAKRPVALPAL
jgi:hypothetical protein